MGQQKPPVAMDDSVFAFAGSKIYIDVLSNDYWMEGHHARIYAVAIPNTSVSFNDSLIIYSTDYDDMGERKMHYVIHDMDNDLYSEVAILKVKFINNAFNTLSVNNLNASFNARGNHHRVSDSNDNTDFLVFDKGHQKSLIESFVLWIGGKDEEGTIHLAAESDWDNQSNDFWMGPVAEQYNVEYFEKWSRIWKVSKNDITYHQEHWRDPYYQPMEVLATWPGGGDHYVRETTQFAPYHDYNKDGIYNPDNGDYPLIRGDEALFFVYNDDVMQHATEGRKLGVEIRGMAYAYHCPDNDALSNAIFVHYEIINRSDTTYYDTYLGVYGNMSIGSGTDDYIECDVMRNSFYGFNGDAIDGEEAGSMNFGQFAPAQSLTILGGPMMDNERLGMKTFITYHLDQPQYYCDPPRFYYAYYLNMMGYWRDGTRMEYGGKGHAGSGSSGPVCNYMLPGNSDPLNLGTGGILPNDGYNQNDKFWTEDQEQHAPHHISGMSSMGPFTFEPGETQELDLVFVFGRDSMEPGPRQGISIMKARIDSIMKYFQEDRFPCQDDPGPQGAEEIEEEMIDFEVYPNPCSGTVFLRLTNNDYRLTNNDYRLTNNDYRLTNNDYRLTNNDYRLTIFDLYEISGRKIRELVNEVVPAGVHEVEIDVSDLPDGVYFVRVRAGSEVAVAKLLLVH
ncbi:MAG: T9SS type A sorting domain-containing protein [Bacteroidota bacterium]|nr:T9SS type A sorting domain-containing protein [Bacteroidota bacterium]